MAIQISSAKHENSSHNKLVRESRVWERQGGRKWGWRRVEEGRRMGEGKQSKRRGNWRGKGERRVLGLEGEW